jgi:glycosyltransferase involved in cell wall biosynthesis
MAVLTIAIPTFNRPLMLMESVGRILPQLDDDCELLIVDNASDRPAGDLLAGECEKRLFQGITVVRNRANIGSSANIIRCLELAESEWVWIVGDDDFIRPDGVRTVKQAIGQCQDATFLNFGSSEFVRTQSRRSAGVEAAISDLDNFGNLLFISTGVYRREKLLVALRFGYHFAYSCGPHVAALLASLGDTGIVYWLPEVIVDRPVSSEESYLNFSAKFLGLPTLVELPIPEASRSALARKIATELPSLAGTLAYCGALALRRENQEYARWVFASIVRRNPLTGYGLADNASIWICSLLLHSPGLGWYLLRLIAKLRGRPLVHTDPTRSFARL